MARVGIFFLHGFLGLPTDWDPVLAKIPRNSSNLLEAIDYFHLPDLQTAKPLPQWGEAFNQWVLAKKCELNVLVGYSLGGRLALQALAQNPSMWSKALLISTNPGLPAAASAERAERQTGDALWAHKFQNEEWTSVLKEWNSQAVFKGFSVEPTRLEANYEREHLAQALTQWSLSRQSDMREVLRTQSSKILWVSGGDDIKFRAQAEVLKKEIPDLQTLILPRASHRVLFDQPERLAELVKTSVP